MSRRGGLNAALRTCSRLGYPYWPLGGVEMGLASNDVTGLLSAWSSGDDQALDRLTSLVYADLYALAQRHMTRERPGHILQNTALVNELYLRLAKLQGVDWKDRSHFLAVCSRLMRHILVDYARSRLSVKHGGEMQFVPFEPELDAVACSDFDLVALDDALETLAAIDARKSEVVQLRFFGGFSEKEIAESMKVSERTIRNEWRFAKLWLLRELDKGRTDEEQALGTHTRAV